jgi:glycosyltransferase involved in cell wall biosynthesis
MGMSSPVIPNGHPLSPIQQRRRDTILWVGRDDPIKRPELFLDLAKAVPNEHFTMVCQMMSNDQHYANLVTQADAIPNLQFIRHVPFNQIDAYFQRAKIFVNTSDAEGFPNTFIQACKCATPILSFNVNPDNFLDKYSCGICCEGDERRLSEALKFLLAENRYIELGQNARRYVERYHDIIKIVEQYKKVFVELAEQSFAELK